MGLQSRPAPGAPGAGETAQGGPTPDAESKPKDNVVDAEFVDVDEKKK